LTARAVSFCCPDSFELTARPREKRDGFAKYRDHDVLRLAEVVGKGAVHPRELVEAAIARIEAANPKLNALVTELLRARRRTCPFRGRSQEFPFS
jgi:hypothetical protein